MDRRGARRDAPGLFPAGSRMKPRPAPTASARSPLREAANDEWRERAGRLFGEFERPAKAMVRRAFRGAFCPDELDDIYAGAWVGTLRALAGRQAKLSDDEIRSYVLTAVANQAGKELRRRRRKPTASLELVGGVADQGDSPEERAASREQSRIARDLLASMPPRRRAVMLLRYGWGLEPSQVCRLIAGLSPRAYRKEVTRGVDELTEKMRAVERGDWCADREPVLKAFVAGVAGEEQTRQAKAHLSHCRPCASFVARLSGHLHDFGAGASVGAIDGIDGHLALSERLFELGERATGLVARGGGSGADEATAQAATAAGVTGAEPPAPECSPSWPVSGRRASSRLPVSGAGSPQPRVWRRGWVRSGSDRAVIGRPRLSESRKTAPGPSRTTRLRSRRCRRRSATSPPRRRRRAAKGVAVQCARSRRPLPPSRRPSRRSRLRRRRSPRPLPRRCRSLTPPPRPRLLRPSHLRRRRRGDAPTEAQAAQQEFGP